MIELFFYCYFTLGNNKFSFIKKTDELLYFSFLTDGGSGAHSDRLMTNRDDNNDSRIMKDKTYKTNISILPVQFREYSNGGMYDDMRLEKMRDN